MGTVWVFLIPFAQGKGLVNTSGVSISFRQISRFSFSFSFFLLFFLKRPKGLLLETYSGLLNVDGVFLGNKLVNGRMALLFLVTFFERAIYFVLKVAD